MDRLICVALTLIWIILLIRVILSWVQLAGWRPPATGPIRSAYDLLFDVTEPPLRALRRILPPAGMFDLSVVVAFIIIFVMRTAFC
ncbi:MAG TPA: YggT family protein [Actinomycetota bacterium]